MAEESTNIEKNPNRGDIDDQNANNYIPVKKPGFTLTFNIIVIILIVSTVYLLTVCLISGLVFREINACESKSNASNQTNTNSGRKKNILN